MQLISLAVAQEGMVLDKTIWNDAGHPLLQQGVKLTARSIQRLQQLHVQYIYINNKLSEGIEIKETVPLEVRREVVGKIKTSFQLMNKGKKDSAYILEQQANDLFKNLDVLIQLLKESDEALTVLSDVFLYDEYVYQHSFQVMLYSLAIAKYMRYSDEELKLIGLGALLHDVGKMLVPQDILNKPGRLTDDEYKIMKQHSKYGFELLRNLYTIPLTVAHCAFQHHERLDGSGYPRSLQAKDIHPYAKIIAVADVFDALSSTRVYRKKMMPTDCLAIIHKGAGIEFDVAIVEALAKSIVHYPNGTIVKLNDNSRGIIARQNPINPMRPVVRIFERDDERLQATQELALIDIPQIKIEQIEPDYVV